MDVKQFFNNVPAFQDLPAEETAVLLETLHLADYPAGYTFFQQGIPTQGMYLLLDGGVLVARSDDQEAVIESSELRAGEFFGVLGLVSNVPSTTSARTLTAASVAQISQEGYHALTSRAPTAALRLQRMVAVQLARELQFRNRLLRARMRMDMSG